MGKMNFYKLANWIGIILSISGACLYGSVVYSSNVHFSALTLPVSLAPGTVRTPTFMTDFEENYIITLDFDRQSGIDKIGCFLGSPALHPEMCEGVPHLINISWTVFQGERVIAQGDSSREVGTLFSYPEDAAGKITGGSRPRQLAPVMYTDVIQRTIGGFRAAKGQRYTLALEIKRDASALQEAHPQLVVRIPPDRNEHYALESWWQGTRSVLLGLVGLVILVITQCLRLLGRRKGPHPGGVGLAGAPPE